MAICSSCNSLIFYPDHFLYSDPRLLSTPQSKVVLESLSIPSSDGVLLHAWWIRKQIIGQSNQDKKLLIFFHGNAQNLSAHVQSAFPFLERNFDIIIFDYRGYGLSTLGVKNELDITLDGVYEDGLNFLKFLDQSFLNLPERNYLQTIVWAQSLGGHIFLHSRFLQAEELKKSNKKPRPFDIIVLDSTFLNPKDVGQAKFRMLGRALIPSPQKISFLESIHFLEEKVLVTHCNEDSVIPVYLGYDLYQKISVQDDRKFFWSRNNCQHNSLFYGEQGESEMNYFLKLVL